MTPLHKERYEMKNPFARLQKNKPRQGRPLLLLVLVGSLLLLLQSAALAQVEDDKQHLLVLNSYHQGFTWTNNIVSGVNEVFAGTETEIEVHVEYMDTKRRLDDEYLANLYRFYREKYEAIPVDAVIVADNNALEFMRAYGEELFPDVPIIFAGINNFSDALIADFDQITGVVEAVDISMTIELMLSLHPETEQIYVVNDQTPSGEAVGEQLEAIIPAYADETDFVILDGLTMNEIQDELADLPPDSLVLMLLFNRDAANQFFTNEEGIILVSRAADAPIYSVWDFYLGHGLVGGWLTSGVDQGRIAGEMARRVLQGEAVESVPIVRESPNRYLFDYNELERFNIALSQLPEESTVINQPVSFYEQYETLIWAAGAVIVILMISVGVLLANVAQRQQAEAALQESHRRRGRQVELTTQMAQDIAAAASLDDLYHRVVHEVKERFDYYHAQLLRYDPETGAVRLIAGAGEIGAKMKREGHQMPMGVGLIGQAAATGDTIMRPNLAKDPDWRSNPLLPQTRGEIAVPIKMGDEILGVLDVQSDEANALTTDDRLLLEGLCGQIAIAIHNTQTGAELRRLGELVEQSLDGLAIADLAGVIQFANPAWAKMHGYTVEEIVGRNLSMFHTEEQLREEVEPVNEQAATTGQPQQGEVGHVRRDGSTFPTWMTISLLYDRRGKPVNLAAWAQDITEQKEAEAKLRQEQERLHTILESLSVPVVISMVDGGETTYVNEPLAKIIGVPRDDLVGRVTPDFYVDPAQREEYLARLRAEGAVRNMELALKRANGEHFWALLSGRIIQYQEQTAILTTLVDITARKEAQAAIVRQAEEMSTVAQIGTAAARTTDADQLLPEMVHLTKERFGLYHAHVYLLDEEAQRLRLTAGAGEVGEQMVAEKRIIPLYQEQSLVARAARSGRGIRINDVTEEPDYLPHPLLPDTRAEMAVPMSVGDRVIGVLDVQSEQIDFFTEEDVNIYTTLAAQLAVSLQNARQYEETQAALQETAWEVERLAQLNEMSAALSAAVSVNEVYEVVGKQLRHMVRGDRSSVALLNEDGETFNVYALSGESGVVPMGTDLPLEGTAVGLAIRKNHILRVPGDANYTMHDFLETKKLAQRGIRSTVSAPLMSGGRIIGALNVGSKEEEAYRQSDVNFLQQIVTLLANVLETLRLDERARLLASIVENHPDFIGVGTLEGEAVYVNPSGLEMMLYPADHDVTEMDAADFYVPADAERVRKEGIPTALETGVWTAEAQLLRRDGTTIPVEEIVSINYDAQGEPVSFSITMHDITERKATEAAQSRLNRQLEEQVQQLNRLQQAMTQEGWQAFLMHGDRALQGYAFTNQEVHPITLQDLTASNVINHTGFDLTRVKGQELTPEGDAVLVPLEVRGQQIGVLGARTPSGEPLDEESQAILRTISEEVAETLERARLFEETELNRQRLDQRASELQAVAEISATASTTLETRQLLDTFARLIKDRLNLYHCNIFTFDETGEYLSITASSWRAEEEPESVFDDFAIPLHSDQSLVAKAARTRQPVLTNDVGQDPGFLPSKMMPHTRAELSLPLIAGGQVVGVLDVQAREKNRFSEEDVRIQETLAAQIAVSWYNAQLYTETQRRAEREAMINTISQKIQSAVTVEAALQTAVSELGRALNARQAQVRVKPSADDKGNGATGGGNGRS